MAPSVIKEPKVNLRGHTYWCRAVQWSPDGDLLATASADNNVRVFQQCGTEAFKVKHPDWVWAVDFSFTSKRKRLATACLDGKVRVFDAIDGREILTIQAHGDKTVNCVVFSPNGEQILTGAYDMTAKIFNVGNGKEMQCIDGFKGPVLSATFTVDSSCVVAGSSKGQLVVIDASNGKVLQRIEHAHAGKINSVTASADGKLLATAGSDKCAKVWHVGASGQWALIKTLKMAEEVTCVAWSPDQLLLAASSTDSTVRVYHASDGWNELARIKGHTDEVNGVSIINKGNRTLLATASDDKTALVFDISAISVQLKVAAAKSGKAVCQITAGLPDGAETAPVSVGDPADMEGLD